MSDRWDEEVWLYETAGGWDAYSERDPDDPDEKWCRYIRADLYEQAEAAAGVLVLALEIERDRLRAALERIVDIDTDWRMGVAENATRMREVAEEALDHD